MATYKITKAYFNGIALFQCTYYKVVTEGYYTGAPENCYDEEVEYMQPEYQFAFEDILYEEIPSTLLQHADAMYEGDDYDPRYYCQMTEVE